MKDVNTDCLFMVTVCIVIHCQYQSDQHTVHRSQLNTNSLRYKIANTPLSDFLWPSPPLYNPPHLANPHVPLDSGSVTPYNKEI